MADPIYQAAVYTYLKDRVSIDADTHVDHNERKVVVDVHAEIDIPDFLYEFLEDIGLIDG